MSINDIMSSTILNEYILISATPPVAALAPDWH